MGLDGVEMVMSWEAAFDITIADKEAFHLLNTRMVVDLICHKLGAATTSCESCLSLRAFQPRRKGFGAAGVGREIFRPDTGAKHLMRPADGLEAKEIIRLETGWRKLLLTGGWTGDLFSTQTVSDLVLWVLLNEPGSLLRRGECWSRPSVREVVRAIVYDVAGVPCGFSDEAHFVDELGID